MRSDDIQKFKTLDFDRKEEYHTFIILYYSYKRYYSINIYINNSINGKAPYNTPKRFDEILAFGEEFAQRVITDEWAQNVQNKVKGGSFSLDNINEIFQEIFYNFDFFFRYR